jgi:hypothetical protein
MKIDLAKGTLKWFDPWVQKKPDWPSYRSRLERTEKNAELEYFKDRLGLYVQDPSIGTSGVTFYISSMNASDIKLISNLKIVMPDGIAVLDYLDIDEYYEAYSERPRHRIEVRFAVPPKSKA